MASMDSKAGLGRLTSGPSAGRSLSALEWYSRADQLRASDQFVEAGMAYLEGLRASIDDPATMRAGLALSDGRLHEAEPILRERLRRHPTDIACIRMLGELAARIGRLDDSIKLLRRALELAPGFDAARELLARNLSRNHNLIDALHDAEILCGADPRNPSNAMLKASILVKIGDQAGALDVYERLLANHADQPKGWMSMGHVLKTVGRKEEAIAAYRRALALQPTLGEAWWSLANLKTFHFSPNDKSGMERLLEGELSDDDRLHIEFALGKCNEDEGHFDRSFAHYRRANAIRRQQLPYRVEDIQEQCGRGAALYSAGFFAARAQIGCPAADPIFIVGLPRSGSTLLEQILASHSQIEGTMELPEIMAIAGRLSTPAPNSESQTYSNGIDCLSPRALKELGEEYIEKTRIYRKTRKPYFIDKMPNNWAHVGLIKTILPNAKIIDARRHPVACCFSAWKQHFARGQAFSYDLNDIGKYYRAYVNHMEHFDGIMPGAIHHVLYEDVVRDTEGQARAVLNYLGLEFETACLSFWRNDRAVRTPSSEQVRQPIYKEGLEQWRHFEPWLGPLVEALGPAASRQ